MTIYLAEGEHRTLVGRRRFTVSGPHDLLPFGSVHIVRPLELPAGEPLVSFSIPRTAGWRILGRSRADYRMLNARADRDDMRRAVDATVVALGHWPSLGTHVALPDAGPALATALWDLAGVLAERDRVRVSWAKLAGAVHGVPVASSIRAEVAERIERARSRIARLTADVATRLQHLSRLADEAESFVRRQRILDEAQSALRDADYLLDTGDAARLPPDVGADLADHTTAVLAAYRELTS